MLLRDRVIIGWVRVGSGGGGVGGDGDGAVGDDRKVDGADDERLELGDKGVSTGAWTWGGKES